MNSVLDCALTLVYLLYNMNCVPVESSNKLITVLLAGSFSKTKRQFHFTDCVIMRPDDSKLPSQQESKYSYSDFTTEPHNIPKKK
jgi:hypothetical protein